MPGESPAVFGDALRRLAAAATYLYQDGPRFWYATQPTVTKRRGPRRTVEARSRQGGRGAGPAAARRPERTGDFARIHPLPRTGADVPDDLDTRLVVLPAEHPYTKEPASAAESAARAILESRGNTPRLYRNTLVFLAADKVRLQDLDEAVRKFLAWRSILDEKDALNLDPHQVRQAETQKQAADGAVTARVPETCQWLLVPEQIKPESPITWQAIRLSGGDALAVRASKKLRSDESLVTSLGFSILRKHLDEVPLWRGDHVAVRQLVEDFARYLCLPRLARCWFRPSATAWPCSRGNRTRSRMPRASTNAPRGTGGFAAGRPYRFRLTAQGCWSSRTWRGDSWMPRRRRRLRPSAGKSGQALARQRAPPARLLPRRPPPVVRPGRLGHAASTARWSSIPRASVAMPAGSPTR
jgi:hypothetical protein